MEEFTENREHLNTKRSNRSQKRRRSSSSSTRSRSRSRDHRSSRRRDSQHHHHSSKRSRRSRSRQDCDCSRRSRTFSRSPSYHRRPRYYGTRENPYKSRVVGVFGLSAMTNEAKLMEIFEPFGSIEHVSIIHDAKTGNSRGFGFIYYSKIEHATQARTERNGSTLDGKRIRVDYSITKRPHTPTPGKEKKRFW